MGKKSKHNKHNKNNGQQRKYDDLWGVGEKTKYLPATTGYITPIKPASPPVPQEIKISMEKSNVSHNFESVSDTQKDINIIVSRNGVFERRENEIGIFTYQLCEAKDDNEIIGLKEMLYIPLALKLPKLPVALLQQVHHFFKDVCEKQGGVEAAVQIFWNREVKSYFIYVNEQIVTTGSVNFVRDEELEKKHLLVMDIHSHNTMNAFWSATDDRDEKGTRLFGVIGKLEDFIPEMKFRLGVSGRFIDLELDEVFDSTTFLASYPEEWLEKVKKPVATTYSGWDRDDWNREYLDGFGNYRGYDNYNNHGSGYKSPYVKPIDTRKPSERFDDQAQQTALANDDAMARIIDPEYQVEDVVNLIKNFDSDERELLYVLLDDENVLDGLWDNNKP